jgi:hypothetical protein
VPSSGAGPYNVCQLPAEATCTGGAACFGNEVCGSDGQCRAPCQTSSDCISGQTCLTIGGLSACYDPHDATDSTVLTKAGVGRDGGVRDGAVDARIDGARDAARRDGSGAADVSVDTSGEEPFVPNPDAGTLGFTISNVGPTLPNVGDGGADSGAGDVTVTESCEAVDCLPAPVMITMTNGNLAALYTFDSLTVVQTAALAFTGTVPIILLARTSVNIQGEILVHGTFGNPGTPGPGGFSYANVGPGGGQPGDGPGFPNSGAGGGSFCGTGGSGGASPPPAAAGGSTYGTADLVPLLGGSAGGVSGSSTFAGPGGGAIEIVAGQEITIGALGAINAGGGGGYEEAAGGSGGAILLEAPAVYVSGTLAANGGGGGENVGSGADGTANATPAPGYGGIGGMGSAGTAIKGSNGLVPDGSSSFGGGGGGGGRIRINTATGTANISSGAVISPSMSPATPCATQGTLN